MSERVSKEARALAGRVLRGEVALPPGYMEWCLHHPAAVASGMPRKEIEKQARELFATRLHQSAIERARGLV